MLSMNWPNDSSFVKRLAINAMIAPQIPPA
jgi:hypothetical protein